MFGTRQTFLHYLIYLTLDSCFLQFSGMEEKGCCLSTWQSRQFSPSSRSSLHPGSFSALYSSLLGWDKVPIIWLHLCSVLLFFSLIIMFAVSLTCNMFQKFFYFSFESQGTEILSPKIRKLYSTLGVNIFFGVGYMLLPLFAFLTRGWRMLLMSLVLTGFLYVPLWW